MKRLENIGGESIIKSYKRHKMERENPPKENKSIKSLTNTYKYEKLLLEILRNIKKQSDKR